MELIFYNPCTRLLKILPPPTMVNPLLYQGAQQVRPTGSQGTPPQPMHKNSAASNHGQPCEYPGLNKYVPPHLAQPMHTTINTETDTDG